MKVFLDIDGVMVHANPSKKLEFDEDGFYKFNEAAIQSLQKILAFNSNIEIILSTSHRFRYSIEEWLEIFISRGLKINKISRIESPLNFKKSRKDEIINWIELCKFNIEELIIIDDDKSLNSLSDELKERLILTDSYIGLNQSIVHLKNNILLKE